MVTLAKTKEERKQERIERRELRKKKRQDKRTRKLQLRAGLYYSRSYNQWNGNQWIGNVLSASVSNNIGLPSVGYWFDPITKARGVTFGIKIIGGRIL